MGDDFDGRKADNERAATGGLAGTKSAIGEAASRRADAALRSWRRQLLGLLRNPREILLATKG